MNFAMIHTLLSTTMFVVAAVFLISSYHTSTAWTTMQTSKVVIGFRSIPSHRHQHQQLSSSVVKSRSWRRTLSSTSIMFGMDTDNDNNNDVGASVDDVVGESVVESVGDVVVIESVDDVVVESVVEPGVESVDESVGNVEDIPSTTTKRKRKRKKKKQVIDTTTTNNALTENDEVEGGEKEEETPLEEKSVVVVSEPTSVLELKPREDAPVQMEMANLYPTSDGKSDSEFDLVSSATSVLSSIIKKIGKDKETSADKRKSFEMKNKMPDGMTDGGISRPLNDSLDQLLEDAALMKVAEDEDDESKGGFFSDSDGTGIRSVVGNALSTIVTVDFFIVIGFLVWFIAGIFCSSILKDDTVQILFNNQFETLVQPSLGLLMVAAVGGSFFNKEEQDM